jgi:DNA (cytosine-5)-methyltransferase 1
MRGIRIGSFCTGYGGLDMAVQAVFGGNLAWCADNDRHVSTILAARYPNIPNLGDITTLDWAEVKPVEIMSAGFPCQDISYAGSGAGIKRGTRSGIWINIVEGIRLLAPKIVVVENVAAIRRRGLDQVLGDLAKMRYNAVWTSLRASDVGAAHRRERVFVLGYQPEARGLLVTANARGQRWAGRTARRQAPSRRPSSGPQRLGYHAVSRSAALAYPASESWHVSQSAEHPRQPDAGRGGHRAEPSGASVSGEIAWGDYEQVIRRWESITGRPAPYPTERGTRGQPRLAPAFSEWLMGLPKGFVTDLGLPYSAQHRAIGNGVVPQQAVAALRLLVTMAIDSTKKVGTLKP